MLLVIVMTFSLAACGRKKKEEDSTGNSGITGTDPNNPGTDPNNPGGNNENGDTVTYTVTFNSDGGSEIATQTVASGATINYYKPFKAGYTFLGWYDENDKLFVDGTPVTGNLNLHAKWEQGTSGGNVSDPNADTFTVTFKVDNSVYYELKVENGKKATAPLAPQKSGQQFTGWYDGNATTAFNFNQAITGNLTLTAHFASLDASILETGAYNESLYVVWDGAAQGAKVEYKLTTDSTWSQVDAPLIRQQGDEARVDILGLKAGSYDVKLTDASGKVIPLAPIEVSAYDRSGYAHFNYTDGVGAYKDDGTLKDNALVIYVTEENKDYVMDEICAANSDVNMFKIPYYSGSSGTNWNKNASGIGWWLNNNQYTASNAGSKKNKEPSNTYDAANGGKLGFKSVNRPVVIRFIGTVTTPEGCTAFNSVYEGGGVGDNGHMARLKNLKNVTLEGVGDNAKIFGWGFHFVIGTDATNGQGTSFEVRNLTFTEYPEDAIGMEGQQGKVNNKPTITASVERCWIHDNTFLPGRCDNPAESDKKEGDGSCDFKRGQYLTVSYNWFEYCHKTNLIGSADDSLQYNLTYHHNVWWQCGSRIPLTRQANVHFYNNYVMVDQTEATSPYSWVGKPSPSYVHSLRANCYLFSEANYYDGVKNLTDGKSGGAAKGWNNIIYGNSGTNTLQEVTSRDQAISNSCKYLDTDYSKFDTDSKLFYYNDYALDDAVAARQNALMYAGANGHGITNTAMNKYTPTKSVAVSDSGTTIELPKAKNDTEVNGVLFRGLSGVASGTIKYKGQGITFNLASEAQLTVTTTTTGDPSPELIGADGRVYAHKFNGTLTIILQPGTYVITSGQKDKEAVITSLKFENTTASSAARVGAAVDALTALVNAGEAKLTAEYEKLVNTARTAYNALTADEKAAFNSELYNNFAKAVYDFGNLQMAEFTRLVGLIGTVNENSYNAINAAQQAYDKLTSDLQQQVAGSKATLDAAWKTYEQFAVLNVVNLIKAFATKVNANDINESTARATIEALLDEGDSVLLAYNSLSDASDEDDGQKSQVTNYNDLTNAITKLENINKLFVFQDALDYFEGHTITMDDAGKVTALKAAYEALSATQKNLVSTTEKALYDSVLSEYETIKKQTITSDFSADGQPSDKTGTFTTSGSKKTNSLKVLGTTYTRGLKVDGNGVLTIKVDFKCTVTLYVLNSNNFKLDGVNMTVSPTAATEADTEGYTLTFTLEAGTHTITKGNSENSIYYAVLSPV